MTEEEVEGGDVKEMKSQRRLSYLEKLREKHRRTSVRLTPTTRHIRSESDSHTSLTGTSSLSVLWICERGRAGGEKVSLASKKKRVVASSRSCTRLTSPKQLLHQSIGSRLPSVSRDLLNIVESDSVLREETSVDDEESFATSLREDCWRRRSEEGEGAGGGRSEGRGDEGGERESSEDVREEVDCV